MFLSSGGSPLLKPSYHHHHQSKTVQAPNTAFGSSGWQDYNPEEAAAVAAAGTFRWKRKEEDDKKRGVKRVKGKDKAVEVAEELRKLAERRAEREREEEEREAERARIQRENDMAQLGDWEAKEARFHLEQAKRRADIRMREGRAKPVDLLALLIRLSDEEREEASEEAGEVRREGREEIFEGWEMSLREPTMVFEGLEVGEVEELHADIRMYLELEGVEEYLGFWRAMLVICDDILQGLREEEETGYRGRRAGGRIAAGVVREIDEMLQGKGEGELEELQRGVERKLAGEDGPVDTEYWERLRHSLVVWKAKCRVRGMHHRWMEARLRTLQERQREKAREVEEELAGELRRVMREAAEEEEEEGGGVAAPPLQAAEEIEEGCVSPVVRPTVPAWAKDLPVMEPLEDAEEVAEARARVRGQRYVPRKRVQLEGEGEGDADKAFAERLSKARGVTEEGEEDEEGGAEAEFNVEASLSKTTYLWQDKYRPRKPRYFNRVHTGFEWNKYNQTHYDHDNPPPKVVQGYKFNIFYPDLIEKGEAPTYRIRREGNGETALIVFTAGPPYEDIGFRVIDREWEYSHKKGFKSSFDRGVLQLHFFFKRHYYRR